MLPDLFCKIKVSGRNVNATLVDAIIEKVQSVFELANRTSTDLHVSGSRQTNDHFEIAESMMFGKVADVAGRDATTPELGSVKKLKNQHPPVVSRP